MNVIQPNISTAQSMTVTPRIMVLADSYRISFIKEGTSVKENVIATVTSLQGGRLTLNFSLDAEFNNFYWFKVYANVVGSEVEVYRGKAFATDESDYMKYSIYNERVISSGIGFMKIGSTFIVSGSNSNGIGTMKIGTSFKIV